MSANHTLLALAGIVLSRTLVRGEHMIFIMEMPLYHAPNGPTIARFVWHNVRAFLRKAGSLILIASILLWALGYFPGARLDASYLAQVGRGLAPLGELVGLDWRLLVALLARITGLSVRGRTSAMRYRDAPKLLPQVAEELRVQFVIEGSVRIVGTQVSVTAQLERVGGFV